MFVSQSLFIYGFLLNIKDLYSYFLRYFRFCLVTRAHTSYLHFKKIQWIYTASILHLDHFLFQSNKKCISFCQANWKKKRNSYLWSFTRNLPILAIISFLFISSWSKTHDLCLTVISLLWKNKSWKKFRSGADLTSHEVTQGCLIRSLKYSTIIIICARGNLFIFSPFPFPFPFLMVGA